MFGEINLKCAFKDLNRLRCVCLQIEVAESRDKCNKTKVTLTLVIKFNMIILAYSTSTPPTHTHTHSPPPPPPQATDTKQDHIIIVCMTRQNGPVFLLRPDDSICYKNSLNVDLVTLVTHCRALWYYSWSQM